MTVREAIEKLDLELVNEGDLDREVKAGYAGDLLSWVMGRSPEGALWFTVMGSVNTVAVAVLSDAAAIVCTEGAEPDNRAVVKAMTQGVTILKSKRGTFENCAALYQLLKE